MADKAKLNGSIKRLAEALGDVFAEASAGTNQRLDAMETRLTNLDNKVSDLHKRFVDAGNQAAEDQLGWKSD
ncbi:MAG: hypothetical protein OXI95_07280 [bacterium]|nr:hypothetical protein [bacterium]